VREVLLEATLAAYRHLPRAKGVILKAVDDQQSAAKESIE
jgi:hypothetical protein